MTQPVRVPHVVSSTIVPGQVALARGHRGVDRGEPEGPGVAVEHRAEDRRAVEARQAHPLDVAARRHERAHLAVGEERVVRDRGIRASAQWHVTDDLAHGCANRTGMARGRSTPRRPAGRGTIGRRGPLSTLWPWPRRRARQSAFRGDAATGRARSAARRATPPTSPSTACCTRGWSSRPRRTGASPASTARRRSTWRGSSRCSPRPTCPSSTGAAGRAGQPLARSEIVYSGQPVALVVAETEAAAADGVDAGRRRHRAAGGSARPRVVDGAGRGPGPCRCRRGRRRGRRRRARRGRWRRRGRRRGGAVGQRRRATAHERRRRGGGPGRRDGAGGRALQHELDPPGLHGAAGGHRVARARGRRSWSTRARRVPSARASSWPTCSAGRTTACACARRRWAAPSGASS